MSNRFFLAIVLASFSLTGCDRDASQPVAETPSTDNVKKPVATDAPKPAANVFTGPRAPAGSDQVEAPVADGAPQPLRMNGGQTVVTSFTPERNGTLLALGLRIGNSRGTSDGSLTLNFCPDGVCQDVAVPLPGTQDNGYLIFNLTTPVEVVAGKVYDFKLSRSADSIRPVAIWTHSAPSGARTLIDVDNVDTKRVAKLVYYLKK